MKIEGLCFLCIKRILSKNISLMKQPPIKGFRVSYFIGFILKQKIICNEEKSAYTFAPRSL